MDTQELKDKLVKNKKIVIFGILILSASGLFAFFYFPKAKEFKKIKKAANRIERQIKEIRRMERGYQPPSSREEEVWQAARYRLRSIIPTEKDIPQFIYELTVQARKNNIIDIAINSKEETKPKRKTIYRRNKRKKDKAEEDIQKEVDYDEISGMELGNFNVKLSLHSNFKDLAYFLDDIQKMGRFLEVQSLVIKKEFPLILVEITIKTYYNKNAGA
ncbi:MAG: hypothetical protein ACUZ8E_04600 [Candidatus Anammoxibacter sp.]